MMYSVEAKASAAANSHKSSILHKNLPDSVAVLREDTNLPQGSRLSLALEPCGFKATQSLELLPSF
jgi:hypothetical protein